MKPVDFSKWSRVGLGTGTLASVGRATTASHVGDLLSSMREIGATVIDTADSYTSGRCEAMLGAALRGRRDDFVVVTKAGYRYGDLPSPFQPLNPFIKKLHQKLSSGQCHSPAYLTHSLERSLKRLKLDHVDAFLLHDPPLGPVCDPLVQASLLALQKAGKTVHLGVSSSDPQVLNAAIDAKCFTVIQNPANPTTLSSLSPVWKRASDQGIHLMANHVFYSGKSPSLKPSSKAGIHEILMRSISARFPAGTILVGTRNPEHLAQSFGWARNPMTNDELQELEANF